MADIEDEGGIGIQDESGAVIQDEAGYSTARTGEITPAGIADRRTDLNRTRSGDI